MPRSFQIHDAYVQYLIPVLTLSGGVPRLLQHYLLASNSALTVCDGLIEAKATVGQHHTLTADCHCADRLSTLQAGQ